MMPPNLGTYEIWGLPKARGIDSEGGGGSSFVAQRGGDIFSIERYGNDDWFEDPVPFG